MIISVNKKRVPILVIIGLIVATLLIMAIVNARESDDVDAHQRLYLYYGLVITCLYYTSYSIADYWKTLFNTKAILSIEPDGLMDNLSIFSCGKVQWGEITKVQVIHFLKTNFLVIHVRNPELLINQQSIWKKNTLRGFHKKFGSPVVISQKRINESVEDIKNVIAGRLQ